MRTLALLWFAFYILDLNLAVAQDYPSKPIHLFVSPPGGGSDIFGRMTAQAITGPLGQQVVVENHPVIVSGEIVGRAPPDGYSIMLSASSFTIGSLMQKVPYDLLTVYAPITCAASSPNVLVVHPSVPVKTVKELIALAKARPGQLNYSSSGTGGSSHLATELFKSMTGTNLVRINYKGGGPAVTAMVSGEVHVMFATAGSVMNYVQAGRLRALAVSSSQPSGLAPGLPTVTASGVPGFEAAQNYIFFAPAKVPEPIVSRLNREIVRALNQPDMKKKFLDTGADVIADSAQACAAMIKSELSKMGKLIKEADIHAE